MSTRLVTQPLVVRDVEAVDAPTIARIWADSELTRFLGGPRDARQVEASVLEAATDPPRLDLWTVEHEGEVIGRVVRTRDNVSPIYVSVGHKIELEHAVRLTLRATTRYRLPEPIRAAHAAASGTGGDAC